MSSAGDVNGDGFDDLIFGAPYNDPNDASSGASFVVFGGNFSDVVAQIGTTGDDDLKGTAGNDVIFAGTGDDTIYGGGDHDTRIGLDTGIVVFLDDISPDILTADHVILA